MTNTKPMAARTVSLGGAAALAILAVACATGPKDRTPGTAASAAMVGGESSPVAAARTLFDRPTAIESLEDQVLLKYDFGSESTRDLRFCLAVPAPKMTYRVERLVLRDSLTAEVLDSQTTSALLRHEGIRNDINTRIRLNDLGVMRRVPLARLHINAGRPMTALGRPMEIREIELALEATAENPPLPRQRTKDTAFGEKSSPIRAMIDLAVANPDAIDRYAVEPPPYQSVPEEIELVDWRPKPELSPNFPWLKIPVDREGLFVIDAAWLRRAEIDPATVNPEDLYLVSNGKAVPLEAVTGSVSSFTEGQRLMFYGQPHTSRETATRWYYLGRRPEGVAPAVFEEVAPAQGTLPELERFRRTLVYEEDNTLQTRVGSFLSIRGMTWIWQPLAADKPAALKLDAPGLLADRAEHTVRLVLYYGAVSAGGTANVTMRLNGREIFGGPIPSVRSIDDTPVIEVKVPKDALRAEDNELSIAYLPQASGLKGGTDVPVYLDRVELVYDSRVQSAGGTLELDTTTLLDKPDAPWVQLQATGFRAYRLNAVDVEDPSRPRRLPVDVGSGYQTVQVTTANSHRILLLEDDSITPAPAPQRSRWKPLEVPKIGADTVVISHPDFLPAAERLAEGLRGLGQEVALADAVALYEHYSGGATAHVAVRAFLRDILANGADRKPYQVVLVGDCTSDGRGLARNEVKNYIPTYSFYEENRRESDQFATDQIYAWLSGEDEVADILVGRISVNNLRDADSVVNKTLAYAKLPPQHWAARTITVSDFGVFEDRSDDMFRLGVGDAVQHRMLRVADFPWEDNFYLPSAVQREEDRKVAPLVTAELQRAFDGGTGVINFFGHGAPNLWSNQRIWFGGDSQNSDNSLLNNVTRPTFVTSFTCNNGAIDYPVARWNVCIAEDMMRVPGGAIACFMPSGPGFPDQHVHFARYLMKTLSMLGEHRLGVASELARLGYQVERQSDDHSRMYIFLGVPSLRLPIGDRPLAVSLSNTRSGAPISQYSPYGTEATVSVSGADRLDSATMEMRTHTGRLIRELPMAIEGSVAKVPVPPVSLSPEDSPLQFTVRGYGKDGAELLGSRRIPLEVTELQFEEYRDTDPYSGSMERDFVVGVRNSGTVPIRSTLAFRLSDTTGTLVREVYREVLLQPSQFTYTTARLGVEKPGAYMFEARASGATAWAYRPGILPGPYVREAVTFGVLPAPIQLMKSTVRILPPRNRLNESTLLVTIANVSDKTFPGGHLALESNYNDSGRPAGTIDQRIVEPIEPILPGRTRLLYLPTRIPRVLLRDVELRWTFTTGGTARDALTAPLTDNLLIVRNTVPDIRLSATPFTVEPTVLTEGVSVIVKGAIVNAGSIPAPPGRIGLFKDVNGSPKGLLPSLAGRPDVQFPALEPGAEFPFRLRWDPLESPPGNRAWLYIDHQNEITESNKGNNLVPVNLKWRTKWNLKAGGISGRAGEPNQLILIARVENTGETDAQRVVVRFYRSEVQNDETFIGETIVPRVPAQGFANAEFAWNLLREDRNAQVKPSFSIALRGSLQRVSSVTETTRR